MAHCSIPRLGGTLCFVILLLVSHLEVSLGDHAVDCCLKVSHVQIPKSIVVSYHEQVKGDGCLINATVFQTKKGRYLCAPSEDDWSKKLKVFVDDKQKRCLNSKRKKCGGMKAKSA